MSENLWEEKILGQREAVVEAARKLRDSLLNDDTDMWETAIFEHLDQTQAHSLNNLDIALDALDELHEDVNR